MADGASGTSHQLSLPREWDGTLSMWTQLPDTEGRVECVMERCDGWRPQPDDVLTEVPLFWAAGPATGTRAAAASAAGQQGAASWDEADLPKRPAECEKPGDRGWP